MGAKDYFPLEEGKVWFYEARKIVGQQIIPLRHVIYSAVPNRFEHFADAALVSLDGRQRLFKYRRDGIYLFHERLRKGEVIRDERTYQLFIPLNPKMERSWQAPSDIKLLEATGPWEKPLSISGEVWLKYQVVSDSETIQINDKTFHDCLVIEGLGRGSIDGGAYLRHFQVTIKEKKWFAPGVGLIKSNRREKASNKHIKMAELEMILKNLK